MAFQALRVAECSEVSELGSTKRSRSHFDRLLHRIGDFTEPGPGVYSEPST